MKVFPAILMGLGVIAIMLAGCWLSVLVLRNPLNNPVARIFPWPVACSTRGCITSLDWHKQYQLMKVFADKTKSETPTPTSAFTTLLRQHLVRFGQLRNPISMLDARRYRENILNLKDENKIKELTGLSMTDYDAHVAMPFLEQESLRQQRGYKTDEELFKQLSKNRYILILPFRFH